MNITIQPSPSSWRVAASRDETSRSVRAALLDEKALDRPIIATGHQPWLWHPGILAKDIAMAVAAQRLGAATFHLAVDHDDHPATTIEVPVVHDGRLTVETLRLGHEDTRLPAMLRSVVDVQAARQVLGAARDRFGASLPVNLQPLIESFAEHSQADSLGEQVARLNEKLMRPYVGATPLVLSSRLASLPAFKALIDRMLHDAPRCAACYNDAVAAHVAARMARLQVTKDRVELPLWAISRERGRQTLFAQVSGTEPRLTAADGSPLTEGPARTLAPKALLMTAFLRRYACDLFIHGKGGGVYDRVMESWWQTWTGEPLAPMAVVSADLRLDFDRQDVPIADRAELDRAVWFAHHLPHNVDRHVAPGLLDSTLVARKRDLLLKLTRSQERVAKAKRFAELHRIKLRLALKLIDHAARAEWFMELHHLNDRFAREQATSIANARSARDRIRVGVLNQAVAMRRDWCFALYPPASLHEMHREFEHLMGAVEPTTMTASEIARAAK